MVFLNRIYTKTGDQGDTGLGDGSRVAKNHARIEAMGDVDELNCAIGMLLAQHDEVPNRDLLHSIQNDLFDVGADLCVPLGDDEPIGGKLRVTAAMAERLETAIDQCNERLQPLNSFILPGGSPAAAHLHHARAVCRRAERRVVTLMSQEKINSHVLIYLNRLSDLLFVLARIANNDGRNDVLWTPGQSQQAKGTP
jgi:cob(I)alamin adenosyltransferase